MERNYIIYIYIYIDIMKKRLLINKILLDPSKGTL